ncbi:hypothetical protein HWV62_5151 [Athelia sp. TMB]|nr:hypothetical protein HWV62_5151 [Athelia sp. TMB]
MGYPVQSGEIVKDVMPRTKPYQYTEDYVQGRRSDERPEDMGQGNSAFQGSVSLVPLAPFALMSTKQATELPTTISKSFLDCNACPEFVEMVLEDASPTTIARLASTCQMLNKEVKRFIRSTYNINTFLAAYFDDVPSFRGLQARTGTIIGGSTAVAFFNRKRYDEDNVNIFANPGCAYEVARHLIDIQHYRYVPLGTDDPQEFVDGEEDAAMRLTSKHITERRYSVSTLTKVFRFTGVNSLGLTVEVLLMATTRSVMHAILNTHSTAAMNIISHDMAVSLYPRGTFHERINQELPGNALHGNFEAEMALFKYKYRGYGTKIRWPAEVDEDTFMFGKLRRVGDVNCWTIPLDVEKNFTAHDLSITSPAIRRNLLNENSWTLVGRGIQCRTKFCCVSLPIFRYAYTVGNAKDALAMRRFFENQWPHELAARGNNRLHQTWWDGEIDNIQQGAVTYKQYDSPPAGDNKTQHSDAVINLQDAEETDSSASTSSFLSTFPVLISQRLGAKATVNLLQQFAGIGGYEENYKRTSCILDGFEMPPSTKIYIAPVQEAIIVYLPRRRMAVKKPIECFSQELPTVFLESSVSDEVIEYIVKALRLKHDEMSSAPGLVSIILNPSSTIYENELRMTTISVMLVSPVLFVWKKLSMSERRGKEAEYCVYFHAQSGPPFSALLTSYLLIKFPQQWSTRSKHNFEPVQIAFVIDDRGSWGVMIFGSNFKKAFDMAFDLGVRNSQKYRTPGGQEPMTVWPENKYCTHLRSVHMIDQTSSACLRNSWEGHQPFCIRFQEGDDQVIDGTDWNVGEAKIVARRITAFLGVQFARAGAELLGLTELLGQESTLNDLRSVALERGVKIPIILRDRATTGTDRGGAYELDVEVDWNAIKPVDISDHSLAIGSQRLLKIRNKLCQRWNGERVAPSILMVFAVRGAVDVITSTVVQGFALRPIVVEGSPRTRGLHDSPYSVDAATAIEAVKKAWNARVQGLDL